MTNGINIREIAMEALMEILEKGNLSHLVLSQVLNKYQYLEKQDRAFLSRLVEGTIERMLTLDYVIDRFSSIKVKKMKPVIRTILRMGTYQLLFMDSVPDSAACNEAVKLAAKKGFGKLKGFVNGVLRNIAREKNSISYESLWVKYSVPQWLAELWISQYGQETAEVMLRASFENQKTTVRLNLSKASREEIKAILKKDQVTAEDCPYPDYALYLSGYDYLEDLEAFRMGLIQVQDLNSMLAAEIAGVKPGDRIIDVCAAPGGKCLHLADMLMGTGHVEARDVSRYKTDLIEENIRRTGCGNIEAQVWDACMLHEESVGKADIVLADVPCSGLGVIGKKSDLKYRVTRESIEELKKLQREILSVVWQYVKPGGTLIYSTCTVNSAENQENVDWFVNQYPFQKESLLPFFPEELKARLKDGGKEADQGTMTFLQGIYPGDGFFLARLKRN